MCHPEAVNERLPGVERHEVGVPLPSGERLPGLCCVPEGGSGPGVLLLSDIYGRTPFYEHLAERLAAEGYVALLPDCFFRLGSLEEVTRDAAFARWERLDEHGALSELEAAVEWLRENSRQGISTVGLLGFCLGGTFALDLCARVENLVTVCYYPFPRTRGGPNAAPRPIDIAGSIRGPILSFWGDQDYIDLTEVREFSDAMASYNVDYIGEIYQGAGHGFLSGLVEGGSGSAAATDSWARTLEFYATHLSGARDH
nr:dienelactone hydrolase family protein [Haloechinothrix aidingensis]